MTTLALSYSRPVFSIVSKTWAGLVESLKLYREYKQTLNELSQLSPREIADLGQGYMSAEQLAFNAVYGTLKK